MTAVVIANEKSNWGAGRRRIRRALDGLRREGLACSLHTTERPGHARELAAAAAAQEAGTVVVMGGDGTVNEVVNGLLAATEGPLPRLGIIPCGSSNDLSKSLGIPQPLEAACRAVAQGRVREVDVGRVDPVISGEAACAGRPAQHFCSASCLGYFAEIAARSLEMKRLRGSLRYVLPALGVIREMGEGWEMRVTADGRVFDGRYAVLLVGNAARFGGLTMLPDARPDDGLLDCLLIEMAGRWEALQLIPLVYRRALHRHRRVTRFRAASLSVVLQRPSRLCNDGEVCPGAFARVQYTALPRRLQVLSRTASQSRPRRPGPEESPAIHGRLQTRMGGADQPPQPAGGDPQVQGEPLPQIG